MIVGHIGGVGGVGSPYEIQKSLRFRASASAYLSRTPTVAGNRKTWTWSGWVKRGFVGSGSQRIFSYYPSTTPDNQTFIRFINDQLQIFSRDGATYSMDLTTSAVFRDPSAWYHLVVAFDTSQATAASRVSVYVNSFALTAFSSTTYPALNYQAWFNNNAQHVISSAMPSSSGEYFDGYLSEINFIDGQALGPEYFGQVSAETGSWFPKKYTGTYGTNGFYLPFNDGSTLGNLAADRSGNGNNWTANNISLTSGVTYDWMDDTPTNNFAVLNPLSSSSYSAHLDGGLTYVAGVAALGGPNSSIGVTRGKWYAEFTAGVNGKYSFSGVRRTSANTSSYVGADAYGYGYYGDNGQKYNNGASTAYGATYTTNDVIGVALDLDLGTLTFYKNGVSQGVAFSSLPADTYFFALGDGSTVAESTYVYANFGQRPFAYTPPAGFKALCTTNLHTPSILNPKKHFDVVLATGANIKSTAEAVFPGNFLEWIKDRGNANNHQLIDTVRGISAVLQSNTTGAETTYSAPSGSSVGWTWKAGGAPVTNNAGSIQSQVSANQQAGFSIVTGTMANGGGSFGHGLGAAPGLVITKRRGAADSWYVWNKSLPNPQQSYLVLNGTAAQTTHVSIWNGSAPTSLVFSLGGGFGVNGDTFVAYCFAEIPGFSKIGSYTGNGSADGPFVYCGFRSRFVLFKSSSLAEGWVIFDTVRNTANVMNAHLYPHLTNAETISTGNLIDVTAHGFKLRGSNTTLNGSGASYIFYAVAEQPFQFASAR